MSESVTRPQSDDTPSDIQPVISELRLPQEPPPPARWHVSRSALLLVGGPLAGALLVWLGIVAFRSDPAPPPPAAVAEQPAPEPAPVIETQPAIDASVASSAEAEPAPEPLPEPVPETVAPESPQPSDAPLSAVNEVIPNAPQSALDTIRGTVRVSIRVTIDSEGAVVDATADDPGPSRYFERLSREASKKWTFTPANAEEPRTMLVKFNFTREGVTARAIPDEERNLTPQP